MEILITAILSLACAIVGPLIVDRIKLRRPKLKVERTGGVPLDVDGKHFAAYLYTARNASSITIREIEIVVDSVSSTIVKCKVESANSVNYEQTISDGKILIKIPYLGTGEFVSVHFVEESKVGIFSKPKIGIRSPNPIMIAEESDLKGGMTVFQVLPALTATIGAFIPIIIILTSNIGIRSGVVQSASKFSLLGKNEQDSLEQFQIITVAAAAADLSDLIKLYATSTTMTYYAQGPLAYSLAKQGNPEKYQIFLEYILSQNSNMADSSRACLQFYLAKIFELEGKHVEAGRVFAQAVERDKVEAERLVASFKLNGDRIASDH